MLCLWSATQARSPSHDVHRRSPSRSSAQSDCDDDVTKDMKRQLNNIKRDVRKAWNTYKLSNDRNDKLELEKLLADAEAMRSLLSLAK